MRTQNTRQRPLIAFFDYPDVFEDFYPHYGVDQYTFATRWDATGNHKFISLLQREIGDVIWYSFSLAPKLTETRHEAVGCLVKFLPSSLMHRILWSAFYLSRSSWRWRQAYPVYATMASYLSLLSLALIKTLKDNKPDFILAQDYSSGRFDILILLARILNVPLIARHSGSSPERYIGRPIKKWTIPLANRLIVSSQQELEMLASLFRIPRERLEVILTPIDTSVFRPLDRHTACAEARLEYARRYILYMGRLENNLKRVDAIIRAFTALADEHPEVDLLIAGDGPDAEKLKRLTAENILTRIRFLGWISGKNMKSNLYNASDCLVLASKREGFPTVVGEAMACGIPVLAPDVGGISELVVEGQTGWLVAPEDDRALKTGLAFVLKNPEQVASMRLQARRVAEDSVSKDAVTVKLKRCFEKIRTEHED